MLILLSATALAQCETSAPAVEERIRRAG